jgi:hypothetical protein
MYGRERRDGTIILGLNVTFFNVYKIKFAVIYR